MKQGAGSDYGSLYYPTDSAFVTPLLSGKVELIKGRGECSPPVVEKDVIEYTDGDEIIKKMFAVFKYCDQM